MHTQSIKQKLLKGGAWAFAGKVAAALTGLAVNALLARLLTPEEMGAYFLSLSIVSIFAVISQLGLNQTVVRLIAASMEKGVYGRATGTIRIAFCMTFLGSILVAGVVFLGLGKTIANSVFHSSLVANVVGLLSIWIAILSFQSLFAETFRGFHNIKFAALFGGLLNGLISVCLFGLLWFMQNEGSLELIILYSMAGGLTSNAIAAALLYLKVIPRNGDGDIAASEVMRIAWPLLAINLTVVILTQADIWIVGFFLPPEDVALYGAAAKLAQTMMLATSLLYAFLPPIIAQLYTKGDIVQLQSLLRAGALANTILISPLLVFFIFFPTVLIEAIYGSYYSPAHLVLAILSIGLFVNVLTGMRGYVLMMCGYERTQMYIAITGGLMNIIVCSIGALYWGINGVAVGAMISMIAGCTLELLFVKSKVGIWTYASLNSFVDGVRIIVADRRNMSV